MARAPVYCLIERILATVLYDTIAILMSTFVLFSFIAQRVAQLSNRLILRTVETGTEISQLDSISPDIRFNTVGVLM